VIRRARLDGLELEGQCDGSLFDHDLDDAGSADPLEPLLGGLATGEGGPADVIVSLALGSERSAPSPPAPSFFQGGVKVGRTASGWLLRDGACWVEVDTLAAPLRVEAHVPSGRHHLAGFLRTTLFVGLVLALRERGRYHVHAGLVREGGGTWLLVGPSGSGKSTTTVALASLGFDPLADDAVLVRRDGRVVPLPRSFHLSERSLSAFPELGPRARPSVAGKLELELAAPCHEALAPDVVVVLAGVGERTIAKALSPTDALGSLVEGSALLVVDGATAVEEHLAALRRLVAAASPVELRVGPDALARPSLLRERIEAALARDGNERARRP
jgi:hypothetical protein